MADEQRLGTTNLVTPSGMRLTHPHTHTLAHALRLERL